MGDLFDAPEQSERGEQLYASMDKVAERIGEGKFSLGLMKWEFETMKITITIEDSDDGHVNVSGARVASDGETEESVTSATALADAMFEVMDQLGEVEGV